MLSQELKNRAKDIYREVIEHIETKNICCFSGREKPLFLISETYPGVWMEHIYDGVFYAKLDPARKELAKTTLLSFIELQREDGHLPFAIFDPARMGGGTSGYSQIQECVSFGALCFETYEITEDVEFLKVAYESCKNWISWMENNRMTRGGGLVEMFVGYDTGHDHSARLDGLSCIGNYRPDNGAPQDASVLPPDDDVAPVFAVDMNCNFYGNLKAVAKMARLLGSGEEEIYEKKAAIVKQRLIEECYDEKDAFFYDVDKHGNKRKYLSSTIFHLFLEGVLSWEEDREMIERIYGEHIKNPEEFWTEYPFPSMAVSDPAVKKDAKGNCWGYFSQALIALRCTRWMDRYGWSEDFDHLCERWVEAWTRCYDRFKFGQELDPYTGNPSSCSEWYSSCMLFYIYAVRRLNLI